MVLELMKKAMKQEKVIIKKISIIKTNINFNKYDKV